MKKLLIALAFSLLSQAAWAQNPTCPTRPLADSSNACASTEFVQTAITNYREKLTSSRSYYVRVAGSNANCSGLVNVDDPGTGTVPRACAFSTPQNALRVIFYTLDIQGNTVTVDMTGAFTSGVGCIGPFTVGGSVIFTSTAGATITTAGHAFSAGFNCAFSVTGNITISTTAASGGAGLFAYAGGKIQYGGITFGATDISQIQAGWILAPSTGIEVASDNATITAISNYTISGSSLSHLHCVAAACQIVIPASVTVTLTGTPAFSAYFVGITRGLVIVNGTFSGAATGQRYYVHRDGTLIVGSASRTYMPGNAVGQVLTGGSYMSWDDTLHDFGFIDVVGTNVAAPTTPDAGTTVGWFDATDKRWHEKNDAGTIGTTVVSDTGAANNFLTAISAAGVISKAQPSASNLSNGVTGTGAVALADSPVFTTQITTPKIIGGSGTGSSVIIQSTSGAGTTDFLDFLVGNAGAVRVARGVTTGQLVFGNTSALVLSNAGTVIPKIQLHGIADASDAAFGEARWVNTAGGGAQLYLAKSRGATVGTHTIVQSGDTLGGLVANGSDGTNFVTAASIQVQVDGTPGANDMPGRIALSTSLDGSATTTLRMTIFNDGGTRIGSVATSPGAGIFAIDTVSNAATTRALCWDNTTGIVSENGTVGTCTVSDGRLKNVEGPIKGALDKLLKINGIYFTWKDQQYGKGHQAGVIAQDVQKVFPELVSEDGEGKLSADYQRLTAPIIEALREINGRLKMLENRRVR